MVPLVNASADEPFVLEVRYVLAAGQPLALPVLPDEAAVQKVYLCAFVPAARDVIGTKSSWSDDFEWVPGNDGRWFPHSPQTHQQRVAWVCEGNAGASGAAETFHVDGTPLIFSTLRPDPTDTVAIWSIDHQMLSGWIFGATLVIGVILVWTSLRVRFMAVAALLAALAVLGVFWPTLALHVIGLPLAGAAAVILLLWIVSAPFVYSRRISELNRAINTTWLTWVETSKTRAAAAAAPRLHHLRPSSHRRRKEGRAMSNSRVPRGIRSVGWDKIAQRAAGPPSRTIGGPALASSLVPPYDLRRTHFDNPCYQHGIRPTARRRTARQNARNLRSVSGP